MSFREGDPVRWCLLPQCVFLVGRLEMVLSDQQVYRSILESAPANPSVPKVGGICNIVPVAELSRVTHEAQP